LGGNSIISDNKTKYTSKKDACVKHQLITLYSPQQNDIAKRKNKKLWR